MSWRRNKAETDAYLPLVQAILGLTIIQEAPHEEDAKRNSDLIVLRFKGVRVAVRLRAEKFWRTNGHEFTIRYSLPSGTQTEFAKIMDGWGDYFFYGFRRSGHLQLLAWSILDLEVFRDWIRRGRWSRDNLPGQKLSNHDGSSSFLVFRWADMPPGAIVRAWPSAIAGYAHTMPKQHRLAAHEALASCPAPPS